MSRKMASAERYLYHSFNQSVSQSVGWCVEVTHCDVDRCTHVSVCVGLVGE